MRLRAALVVASLSAWPLIAQTDPVQTGTAQVDPAQTDPAATPVADTVQVALSAFTLRPARDAAGAPVLDDAGQPVILRVPLDDSLLTPGEVVLYQIAVENPTDTPALDLALRAEVAAEVVLDPHSIAGPEGLALEWSDAEAPDLFRPLFAVIDGERVMQADLDALRALRLTLPELPPAGRASVEYTVTLR